MFSGYEFGKASLQIVCYLRSKHNHFNLYYINRTRISIESVIQIECMDPSLKKACVENKNRKQKHREASDAEKVVT